MHRVDQSFITHAIICSVHTGLSAFCVVVRIFQRRRASGLRWDDWTILMSFVFCVADYVVVLLPLSVSWRILEMNPDDVYTPAELKTWAQVSIEIFTPCTPARQHRASLLN